MWRILPILFSPSIMKVRVSRYFRLYDEESDLLIFRIQPVHSKSEIKMSIPNHMPAR